MCYKFVHDTVYGIRDCNIQAAGFSAARRPAFRAAPDPPACQNRGSGCGTGHPRHARPAASPPAAAAAARRGRRDPARSSIHGDSPHVSLLSRVRGPIIPRVAESFLKNRALKNFFLFSFLPFIILLLHYF